VRSWCQILRLQLAFVHLLKVESHLLLCPLQRLHQAGSSGLPVPTVTAGGSAAAPISASTAVQLAALLRCPGCRFNTVSPIVHHGFQSQHRRAHVGLPWPTLFPSRVLLARRQRLDGGAHDGVDDVRHSAATRQVVDRQPQPLRGRTHA